MPPLQALVALHGLWLLVLLPFAVWAARKWQSLHLRLVGYALCAAGLMGLAILIGPELVTWYATVPPAQQKYLVHRVLYVLATNTDAPVVQVVVAGAALAFAAGRRQRHAQLEKAEPLRRGSSLPRGDCPRPLGGDSVPGGVRVLPGSEHKAIALWVKLAYTAFVAVLVMYYVRFYGPANFLWLCDIALLVTVAALWLESRLLASMQLVAVLLPCLVWLADFLARLTTGYFLTRWTHYMFRPDFPLVIRALSLYHGWLPFLLLWTVRRLDYDGRGWIAQTLLTWAVLPVCFFFTDPVRALNGVFGPSGEHPQTWVTPGLWLLLMMVVYPVGVYLPTHLALRWFFPKRLSRQGV